MEKFSDFISEQDNNKPYKLLILSHDDPLDPNETGPMIKKKASDLGLQVFLGELMAETRFFEGNPSKSMA